MKDVDPDETTAFVVSLIVRTQRDAPSQAPSGGSRRTGPRRVGAAGIGANCGRRSGRLCSSVVETARRQRRDTRSSSTRTEDHARARRHGVPERFAESGRPASPGHAPPWFGGCCARRPNISAVLRETLSGMPLPVPAAPDYTPLASRSRLIGVRPKGPSDHRRADQRLPQVPH
jgi:hypothetical protein